MTSGVGSLLIAIVNLLFQFASLAILARVIISWLPMAGVRVDDGQPILRILFQITDPLLEPLRRFTSFGGMDFSPIAALILLEVVRNVLVRILAGGL
jgi:YggT family protein